MQVGFVIFEGNLSIHFSIHHDAILFPVPIKQRSEFRTMGIIKIMSPNHKNQQPDPQTPMHARRCEVRSRFMSLP